MFHYFRLFRDKHSSLLDLFVSYAKRKGCELGPWSILREGGAIRFCTRVGVQSNFQIVVQLEKTCHGQTLYLISRWHQWRRKQFFNIDTRWLAGTTRSCRSCSRQEVVLLNQQGISVIKPFFFTDALHNWTAHLYATQKLAYRG